MKVIFLDVDGVLNSEDDLMVYRKKNNINHCILYAEVEDRPLKLLKEIVDNTSAKIVVSSSWRIGCERSGQESIFGNSLFMKLQTRLKEYGMDIYDITPSITKFQRGDEIKAWMSENPVENFKMKWIIRKENPPHSNFIYNITAETNLSTNGNFLCPKAPQYIHPA